MSPGVSLRCKRSLSERGCVSLSWKNGGLLVEQLVGTAWGRPAGLDRTFSGLASSFSAGSLRTWGLTVTHGVLFCLEGLLASLENFSATPNSIPQMPESFTTESLLAPTWLEEVCLCRESGRGSGLLRSGVRKAGAKPGGGVTAVT